MSFSKLSLANILKHAYAQANAIIDPLLEYGERAFKKRHGMLFSALVKIKAALTGCIQPKEQSEEQAIPESPDAAKTIRTRHHPHLKTRRHYIMKNLGARE